MMRTLGSRVLDLLLVLALTAVAAPGSTEALTIPWQKYMETLGYYTGLGCKCVCI